MINKQLKGKHDYTYEFIMNYFLIVKNVLFNIFVTQT